MSGSQSEVTVAVLFADISGSTSLYERVGNHKAHEQISACLALLKQVVAEHDGVFVHSRGDDVVCTFDQPENAFLSLRDMLARTDGGELLVHIGVDYGPVIRIRDDIFGDCVNAAARLSSLANSNEALCSDRYRQLLSSIGQSEFHYFDTRQLKGKGEAAKIYRYATPNLDAGTQVSFGALEPNAPRTTVLRGASTVLIFQDLTVTCAASQEIKIGRAEDCDLVIPYGWISRRHAIVEMRGVHAYVRDVSSNGIYVTATNQPPVLLRRETMLLPPECTLSPTIPPQDPNAALIHCKVNAK